MATTVICGAAYGAALLAAGFHQPVAVLSQFRLENFHMLQAFLTATASSALVYPVLERMNFVPRLQPRSSSPLLGLLTSYDGNILGGAILGAGAALASACPGTLLVQAALGVRSGAFALAGSIVGGAIWSGYIREAIKSEAGKRGVKSHVSTLQDQTGVSREATIVLFESICAAVVGGAATLTDKVPWAIFSGVVSGLFLGVAQFTSLLTRKSMVGISGSYEEAGGHLAWLLKGLPSSSSSRPSAYSNIIFGASAILGAWTLNLAAPQLISEPVGDVPSGMAFLGGLLMTIGSRMAGGCTSGHGISGLSLLSTSSAVTMASTFAAGVLVANWL
ncbi:hypothetical protein NLU13_0771 [Sarocladium strictum]|uniref:Sulphur transport domain-containing protein n=1 Tax=Sarocladium strictum TaxID=5046 RepID=A0AA39GPP6_SARSR|nr:hypothetical protein NLU13_0771 [Sarocladium strictum]